MDYDPSLRSLLHPETIDTQFRAGQAYTPTQIGMEMAHLAYYSFEEREIQRLMDAIASAGFGELKTFNGPLDTQVLGCRRAADGLAVVAFRGTQPRSLEDIGVDINAGFAPWGDNGGQVHRGFRAAFEGVREPLENWKTSAGIDVGKLVVCGHSLGGALATLAASRWKPAHLVTIGSPRVGDSAFCATLNKPGHQRIFNCCDLVARVPPRIGYEHSEPSLFIGADGAGAMPNPGAQRIDAERHAGRGDYFRNHLGWGNAPVRDFADHSVMNYLRAFFP